MPFPRKRNALQFTEPELRKLESIRKSRTEEKRRTVRAALLLDSLSGQSDETIAQHHRISRGTVVRCIQKCIQLGLDAALGELPRTGKPRQLPDDAIAWVLHCACQKPKELGYSYELWTYNATQRYSSGRSSKEAILKQGSRAVASKSPEDFARYIKAESDKFHPVIKAAGLEGSQ
jgi:transposase